MSEFRYLEDVVTLELDEGMCIGCNMCVKVCPHEVFEVAGGKAKIIDRDGCMECGGCAKNCPVDAIDVRAGVGCASGVIKGAIRGTEPICDCSDGCCG